MSSQAGTGSRPRRLGQYLDCPPETVDEALQAQRPTLDPDRRGKRLGELLTERGAVSGAQLEEAVVEQRIARLGACPLFGALSRDRLAELATRFEELTLNVGDELMREGEHDPTLYVLASGRVELYRRDAEGALLPLGSAEAPEPIGDTDYFTGGVRSLSARALETSELLRTTYEALTAYFEREPEVAQHFVTAVGERSQSLDRRLQEAAARAAALPAPLRHLQGLIDPISVRSLGTGMESLIERLIHAASRLTDADRASLFLIDEDSGELWSMVAQGAEIREIRIPRDVGVAGWVATHNQMLNIPEAYDDERFNPEVDRQTGYRTRTILCAPVRRRDGAVAGVVQVINKQFGAFTEDDEQLLRAFCDQVADAVDNFIVYRQILAEHEALTLLLEVATLAGEHRRIEPLVDALDRQLARYFGCERVLCFFLDRDADALWTLVHTNGGAERIPFPLADSPAGIAATEGHTVVVLDSTRDRRFDWGTLAATGIAHRNLMAVPVRDRERRVIGVLQAVNRHQGSFTPEDANTLQAVAAQLGIARLPAA